MSALDVRVDAALYAGKRMTGDTHAEKDVHGYGELRIRESMPRAVHPHCAAFEFTGVHAGLVSLGAFSSNDMKAATVQPP